MVQNINGQSPNQFGTINRVGATSDGRLIYQVKDGDNQEVGKISIPGKDQDVFEKSYKDIMESAPKIQKYAQTHSSPEDIKKRKRASRWIVGICAAIGAGIPIYLTRKATTVKQVLATAVGIVGGLTGGFGLSILTTTPPGTLKFAKASKNLSKIDVRPYSEM